MPASAAMMGNAVNSIMLVVPHLLTVVGQDDCAVICHDIVALVSRDSG